MRFGVASLKARLLNLKFLVGDFYDVGAFDHIVFLRSELRGICDCGYVL